MVSAASGEKKRAPLSRCPFRIIGRTQQPFFMLDEIQRFLLVPDMVARREEIDAGIEGLEQHFRPLLRRRRHTVGVAEVHAAQADGGHGQALVAQRALIHCVQLVVGSVQKRSKTEKVSPVALALAHIGLEQNDAALAELERAVDDHDIALVTGALLVDRVYDPLRADPRFGRILERMHLAQFARR